MALFPVILLAVAGLLAALLILGWIGLRVPFKPFDSFLQNPVELESIPLPDGLPAPVERFYRKLYGERVPVVKSVVISGKARLRPFGPFYLPARFRFIHLAGQGYRHYIEAGLFGVPLFKVNERYVDGKSLFEAPVGVVDNDPKQNQGANLGMWSESLWLPSIFLTDPRVGWEPVDEHTAILAVPFEAGQERYVVRFDPDTGLVTYLESMRYHSPESAAKTLWLNESIAWDVLNGVPTLKTGAAIWLDQRTPWAFFTVEEIVFNVDVSNYLRQRGP